MSSQNDFQELCFSRSKSPLMNTLLEDRKKLDGSTLFDTGIHEDTNDVATPRCEKYGEYLQPEPKYNARKSFAWDDTFFTSPGILEPVELFRINKSRFRDDILGLDKDILLPSGSFEPELSSRVNSSNSRKSLAWDNAFFTDAGLLDPDELSLVNKGFKNYDTRLPGIEQDVSRSTESNYSLDNGTSLLTSIEMDLFEDMRAYRPNSANTPSSSSSHKLQRGKGSKKLEASSQTRMKDTPPFRRLAIDSHATERCTKKASRSVPSRKQLSAGSGELNSSSSHKPPKSWNRVKQVPKVSIKWASSVANSLQVGTPKAASGESSSRSGIMLSTPMSSSCTSPGSPLDGWSSESRSTSVIQRSSNLRESLGTPCRYVSSENTASRESALQSHLHDPSSIGSLPSSISKNSMPSGLRMPSPKIGFFDMENSSVPTTERCTHYHSGLRNATSKAGSSNRNNSAHQTKHGKPPVSRTVTGTRKQNGSNRG